MASFSPGRAFLELRAKRNAPVPAASTGGGGGLAGPASTGKGGEPPLQMLARRKSLRGVTVLTGSTA